MTKDFEVSADCGGVTVIVRGFGAGSRDFVAELVPKTYRLLFRLTVDRDDITLGYLSIALENRSGKMAS